MNDINLNAPLPEPESIKRALLYLATGGENEQVMFRAIKRIEKLESLLDRDKTKFIDSLEETDNAKHELL